MSSQETRHEYRVIWQREGRAKQRRHYQTLKGAEGCAAVQRSAHAEIDWLPHDQVVPEIVFGPVIESREVGQWSVGSGEATPE